MSDYQPPPAPAGLGPAGTRLWNVILERVELEPHESELLRQAAGTADRIEALAAVVEREGVLAQSSQGQRAHPALVEERQQRMTLARLLVALRVPDDDGGSDDDGDDQDGPERGQRRGLRGVYGLS